MEKYFIDIEYYLTGGTSEEIFILKDGYEKEVLDYFIENYPAENYASSEFEKVFNMVTNAEASKRLLAINVIGIVIISIITILINKKKLKINKNKAVSIDNFYCRKNYTLGLYRKVNYCEYCICAVMAGFIIQIFYNEIFIYSLVSLILGAILQLLQFAGKKNEYL